MKVELRSLADIRPYDKNPRVNDNAVEAVARSIREFGFRQPIVVDRDLVIICGHTRYRPRKSSASRRSQSTSPPT
jgi:ParB-like chromosome segregation protein Spo0J